jgi:hypothetical protein
MSLGIKRSLTLGANIPTTHLWVQNVSIVNYPINLFPTKTLFCVKEIFVPQG